MHGVGSKRRARSCARLNRDVRQQSDIRASTDASGCDHPATRKAKFPHRRDRDMDVGCSSSMPDTIFSGPV